MCISVCVHTCRATSADGARLKAVNETCISGRVGYWGQESAWAPTSPLLCVFRFLWKGTSCFGFPLNGATHSWNKFLLSHFSSPPLWLLNTRWSCYNVWMYKVPNVWFLYLSWNADRNAGMSRSRVRPWWEKPLYHFQSAWWPLCSQACVIVCIAAIRDEMGGCVWKETVFYSIFSILFLSPVPSCINHSSYSPLPSNRNKGKPIEE